MSVAQLTELHHLVKRQGGGNVGVNQFVSNSNQSTWVTVYIFLILWFISLMLIPLFRQFSKNRTPDADTTEQTGKIGWGDRIVDAGRAARDGFLILLGMVLINQAGHGIFGGVETLMWIIAGLLFLWYLQFLFFYNPFVDFILLLGFVTLTIINFALAFRNAV